MRVIAGTVGGRRLRAPPGARTRPTADRVKEALFSSLGPVRDARVLDLYAGSGALGIEALSRGAGSAVFVERDRRAGEVIAANLDALGLHGGVVHVGDVGSYCKAPAHGPFDLVLADPPYDLAVEQVTRHLDALAASRALDHEATVVVERRQADAELPAGGIVAWQRLRAYGDTVLIWGVAKGA